MSHFVVLHLAGDVAVPLVLLAQERRGRAPPGRSLQHRPLMVDVIPGIKTRLEGVRIGLKVHCFPEHI